MVMELRTTLMKESTCALSFLEGRQLSALKVSGAASPRNLQHVDAMLSRHEGRGKHQSALNFRA